MHADQDDGGQRPRRLLFVSSSSVYAQKGGEWIEEGAATEPEGYSGRVMLEAERLALASGIPAQRIRVRVAGDMYVGESRLGSIEMRDITDLRGTFKVWGH